MEVIHPRCAGIDVSKRDAKVCVRIAGVGRRGATSTVTTWGAFTNQVLALRDHLIEAQVTLVVMEATGDYWKPFYFLLEDGLNVMLVNARHVKNMPGRKSDVSDAAWLADLGAHGLVRGSFVPTGADPPVAGPDPDPDRDHPRTRSGGPTVGEAAGGEAGVKLSSVASDINGVSGRAMLEAMIAGQRDPAVLADLAKRRLRSKIPALTEALTGRFSEHHAFLARVHLDLIDRHTTAIQELTDRIEVVVGPFRGFRELIATIPGINTLVADVITAETGADMSRFPTASHLASWAGTCPGSNESAGGVKSTKTRPGNPYLKGALGVAAMSAARTKNTYLGAKYRRIASRRGPMKAIVAVEHAMLLAIWNMTATGALYDDPGSDFYTRRNPDKAKNRAIDQLRHMGYTVNLEPAG